MGRLLTQPEAAALAIVCLLFGAGAASAQPAAPDAAMNSLSRLSDRTTGGSVRCPDGSTRPFSGAAPNDLTISMLCDVPADVAAARKAQANSAVGAKNAEAEQRAALAGRSGVAAGLEATAKTGRLDYLLAQRWVWFVGVALGSSVWARSSAGSGNGADERRANSGIHPTFLFTKNLSINASAV